MDFLKLIKQQRKDSKKEPWKGTFLDYLAEVKNNPEITQLAHKRLANAIETHGVEFLPETDPRCKKLFDSDKGRIYNYFNEEFYGHVKVISKMMSCM